MKNLCYCLALLLMPPLAMGVEYEFSAALVDSEVGGFFQTPAGGLPGTTDRHRPTFSELDIEKVSSSSLKFQINRGANRHLLGVDFLRPSGTTTLADPLLTKWKTFDAAESVRTNLKLDRYRIGYARVFRSRQVPAFSWTLGAELVGLDVRYHLKSRTKEAKRSYRRVSYRLGATAEFIHDSNKVSLSAYGAIEGNPHLPAMDLTWTRMLRSGDDNEINLIVGVSWHKIDFRDDQATPNHIQVEMTPLFRLGLQFVRERRDS